MEDKVLADMPVWYIPHAWADTIVLVKGFRSAINYPDKFPKWNGEIGCLGPYRVVVAGNTRRADEDFVGSD